MVLLLRERDARRVDRGSCRDHSEYETPIKIAELEIELEAEGKLPEFIATCKILLNKDWETVRSGAQKLSRASAILHHLDRKLYPSADLHGVDAHFVLVPSPTPTSG
jgi:hypothetical protein